MIELSRIRQITTIFDLSLCLGWLNHNFSLWKWKSIERRVQTMFSGRAALFRPFKKVWGEFSPIDSDLVAFVASLPDWVCSELGIEEKEWSLFMIGQVLKMHNIFICLSIIIDNMLKDDYFRLNKIMRLPCLSYLIFWENQSIQYIGFFVLMNL